MISKNQINALPTHPGKVVWAVGGGKGGTGKTFISGSLGIALARLGRRVILIDADLGCANLHTALGLKASPMTLSDFLNGKVRRIDEVLVKTDIPNLFIISGAEDFLEIANPKHSQKMRLIRQILELNFEIILLDLGAGTSFNILDFFLISDSGILTVIPEPTSIENAYRFIKSAFYRRFKRIAREPEIRELIALAMDQKNERGIRNPHDLIDCVATLNPAVGERLQKEMYSFRPKLVVNQVRSKDDITLGFSMRSSCLKYFGIKMDYAGYIEYDDRVWQAGKRGRPLMIEYPYANSARCVEKIVDNILREQDLRFDFVLRP